MCQLYRPMLSDDDGLPTVGTERNMLGVRDRDVRGNMAGPDRGGMSVSVLNYSRMAPAILPREFGGLNPETVLYELPTPCLTDDTELQLGDVNHRTLHGVVTSRTVRPVTAFQAALGETRRHWTRTIREGT